MANALCTQLNTGVATTSAGLAGGPNLGRSTEDSGKVQIKHANFTIPASGAGSVSGDTITLAYLDVFSRFYYAQVFHTAMGATVTMDIGKTDPNNSANTDAVHYANGADVSLAGNFVAGGANVGEQVGTDPTGTVTDAGNAVPYFGSAPITIMATLHNTPTAAATFNVIIFYSSGAGR